ncbi:MAG TPA: hypothetical protein VE263_17555 [Candidatus Angelobacter sp.]|nr:hypothetical protein [Candidatus Angelobacter sp.]
MSFIRVALVTLTAFGPLVVTGQAQQAFPVGVVSQATNATIGNGNVSIGSTVFSGDLLKTGEQGGMTVQAGSLQFTLGQNTSVRLFRALNRAIVELEGGTLAYSAKGTNEDLTLFALDIRFVPKTSVPASGQINIVSRCNVIATALHSTIDATSGRETKTIEETKSVTVLSEFGVDYKDSWQPVLTDYPEYPRDAQYHHSHSHVACPAGIWKSAVSPAMTSHFGAAVGVGGGIIAGYLIHEVFESPDRP